MRKLVLTLALAAPLAVLGCSSLTPSTDKQKLVILGFDGLDPVLAREWMRTGRLPNFAALAKEGGFYTLETTPSPEGVSAWASFATGVNAGKHNVYGMRERHAATQTAALTVLEREPARFLFDYVPLTGPSFASRRGGRSFWVTAGRAGVRASVLTAPVTFPPEDVPNGELLAGLPLPDLRGTMGTFHYFATDLPESASEHPSRGIVRRLALDRNLARGVLLGPPNPIAPPDETRAADLTLPFTITWNREARSANMTIGDQLVPLREHEWSRWIELEFRANPLVRLRGIVRLHLLTAGQALRLYISPIHWHPADPLAPISSPAGFAGELFERLGPYRTLGWADMAAPLNEGLLDEALFLDDLNRAFTDRAETILSRIDAQQWDLVVGVIDTIDHAQHLLWRLIDAQHPMYDAELARRHRRGVRDLYQRADTLVGDVRSRVDAQTGIVIVSTHGFQPFRWSVNLSSWLARQGHLVVDGQSIDWSRTRVYVSGLGQLSVNRAGREPHGVVVSGVEYDTLVDTVRRQLEALRDPNTGARVVRNVYRREDVYSGPYVENAPDLQVGFARGYRAASAAWPSATVIAPNLTRWSGDHASADYTLVPGVLISNRPSTSPTPRVVDLAPTVLQFFGVDLPAELDGRPLFGSDLTPRQ